MVHAVASTIANLNNNKTDPLKRTQAQLLEKRSIVTYMLVYRAVRMCEMPITNQLNK